MQTHTKHSRACYVCVSHGNQHLVINGVPTAAHQMRCIPCKFRTYHFRIRSDIRSYVHGLLAIPQAFLTDVRR